MVTFSFPFFLVLYSTQDSSTTKSFLATVPEGPMLNNTVEVLLKVTVMQHFEKLLKSTQPLKCMHMHVNIAHPFPVFTNL